MSNVWSVIFGFAAGILSAMGMGGGSILIICLTIFQAFPQQVAQGINLMFFIPIATIATISHGIKNLIDWKNALVFVFLGVIGAALGSFATAYVDTLVLRKILGAFLMIIGITQLFEKNKKQ